MTLPSARDRVLGRTALALVAGAGVGLVGDASAGLAFLLLGLVPVPLVWLELQAEKRADRTGQVVAISAAAWFVTALGLAVAYLQFEYTRALFGGLGTTGGLEAVGTQLGMLARKDAPSLERASTFCFVVAELATGGAAAFASRTARSPVSAWVGALVAGSTLGGLVALARWLTVGVPETAAGSGVVLNPAAGFLLVTAMALCIGIVTGACAAVALMIADSLGRFVGTQVARARPQISS